MMLAGSMISLAASLALLWPVWTDVSRRIITNRANLFVLLLWAAHATFVYDAHEVRSHLLVGVSTFAVGYLLWLCRTIGGGDVKLISVLALWAGPAHVMPFLFITACIGGCMALAYVLLAHFKFEIGYLAYLLPSSRKLLTVIYHDHERKPELPYAVAIAGGGVWAITRSTPLLEGIVT